MDIKQIVDSVIQRGSISIEENKMLLEAVSEDGKLDEEEGIQIHRVMEMIRNGELTVTQ